MTSSREGLRIDITGVNFTNMFTCRFYLRRSQKRKKTLKSPVFTCAFEICTRKSCSYNVSEIIPRLHYAHMFVCNNELSIDYICGWARRNVIDRLNLHPPSISTMEKIISLSVCGATLPKPTDTSPVKQKYNAVL